MATSTWDQKRAQIAQALGGGGGGLGIGSGGMVNPMLSQQPQGLMGGGQTQGQMMAQANASLQGAPGFDYVPPQVGPPPPPPAAPGSNEGMSLDDIKLLLLGGTGAYSSGGHDSGGYSTSGRDSRGSSSSWGGAQRGGGLY